MVKKGVMPGWYANLRIWLGAIAATCLFFMVPESEWSKKRKAARKEQKELELEERKRRVAEREAELERLKLAEMEAEAAILEAKAKAEERKAAQVGSSSV